MGGVAAHLPKVRVMGSAKLRFRIGLVIAFSLLIATAAAVYFPRESLASVEAPSAAPEEAAGVWFCPMHAHVTSDHEGSCPICGM